MTGHDRIRRPDAAGITATVEALWSGSLVGLPTETVYGLGADARRPAAVARIFAAKGRPADNPLIVHLAAPDELGRVAARVTPLARSLADRFWPGPITLVVDARPEVPRVTTGGRATVAVRVPDHPVATAVLAAADLPVAAPSANRSGRPSPTLATHVLHDLGEHVAVILDGGPSVLGLESTVVDARGRRPLVLRDGAVTREELGVSDAAVDPVSAQASPGTRYRHYAPTCQVQVVPAGQGPLQAATVRDAGRRVGLVATAPAPSGVRQVARFGDSAELAQRLYAALRDADEHGLEVLVVEAVPPAGVGRAVMDRLRRAAQ